MRAVLNRTITAAVAALAIGEAMPVVAADMSARELTLKLAGTSPDNPLDVSDLALSFLDLSGLDFRRIIALGADFYGTDLKNADLSGADLTDTRLDRATIIGTDFSNANLSGATIALTTTFTDMTFDVREVARFAGANLTGSRVLARLDGADFSGANLTAADFSALQPATATIASVPRNYLIGARFDRANLTDADFSHADMSFASFVGANLTNANFNDADLAGAEFTGATLDGADFTGADLDGAKLGSQQSFSSPRPPVGGGPSARGSAAANHGGAPQPRR